MWIQSKKFNNTNRGFAQTTQTPLDMLTFNPFFTQQSTMLFYKNMSV